MAEGGSRMTFRSKREAEAWSILTGVAKNGPFIWSDLEEAGLTDNQARSYINGWKKSGRIEKVGRRGGCDLLNMTDVGRAVVPSLPPPCPAVTEFRSEQERAVFDRLKSTRPDGFGVSAIAALGVSDRTAKTYLERWVIAGWLQTVDGPNGAPECHFTGANPPPAQRDVAPEDNLWRSMRLLKSFTALDLAAHSNAGGVEMTESKAGRYCRDLTAAGYLRATRKASPGKHAARYRLIRDTGPKPPKRVRKPGIEDPNTGEFVIDRSRT
jgi:hypothetical protein